MKQQIKDIAIISSWYYIRPSGWKTSINYLQSLDFDDRWEPKNELISSLSKIDIIPERHLLHDWDILVTSKWSRNISLLYKKEYWPSVASSTFFVVKITNNNIIPEYLSIYLNESLKSAYFKNHFSGSTVQSIPKSVLEDYKITIPSLEKQQQIINLYQLHKQQLTIYEDLIHKKTQLINSLILS